MEMNEKQLGLQYPCAFPIKVIGVNHPAYVETIVAILNRHVPDLDVQTITTRESGAGKYLSVSTTFTASDRAQLDALYIELTAHPDVKWVL
jgi:putative lipoic acid-binding regulatory protein